MSHGPGIFILQPGLHLPFHAVTLQDLFASPLTLPHIAWLQQHPGTVMQDPMTSSVFHFHAWKTSTMWMMMMMMILPSSAAGLGWSPPCSGATVAFALRKQLPKRLFLSRGFSLVLFSVAVDKEQKQLKGGRVYLAHEPSLQSTSGKVKATGT